MTPLKEILVVGNFNTDSLESFYVQGFRKCGVTVHTYEIVNPLYEALNRQLINKFIFKVKPDLFYRDINHSLLRFLYKKHFDVILVGKGMELFPDTVAQLKSYCKILCNYNADHPFSFYLPGSGNRNVEKSIPFYDVHFSYSRSIVEQLKSKFKKQAYCIPFGFDATRSVTKQPPSGEFSGKFLFIAAYDRHRARYLNRLQVDNFCIYGNTKWASRTQLQPSVRKAYRGRPLYKDEYITAIASAAGILNLLRQQNILEQSHNMRTFEVPGYGGLLLSQRTTEQTDYFEEDKEAVFFDTPDELEDKINFLDKNKYLVEKIKQAAYIRSVKDNYSYDERSRQLLNCLLPYLQ